MAAKKTAPTQELGLTGLSHSAQGDVEEEFLPKLKRLQDEIKTWKEMSWNDPVVGAIMFALDMLIRQAKWTVEPNPMATDGDQQEEQVQFLKECMIDMSHTWEDFISEVMSMLVYGFAPFEIVYKKRSGPQPEGAGKTPSSNFNDGKIGWRKFSIRSQDTLDRWMFAEDGSIEGLIQKAAPKYEEVPIPIAKLLLFRTTTTKGNPQGRSVLRNAYRPWYFKQRIEEIEAIGIERDLAGLPVAGVPAEMLSADATTEEKQAVEAIRRIVQGIKRDREEGIVWPNAYDEKGNKLFTLELMSSGGTRSFSTNEIIERYDKRIATTILADFIFLGQQAGGGGSYALSSDKTNLFAVAISAWLKLTESVINQWGVRRLFEFNGMDTSNPPIIKHGDIEKPDLTLLTGAIATLAGTGMQFFPDEALEEAVREYMGLPQPSPEVKEQLKAAQAQQQAMMMGGGPAPAEPPAEGEEEGGDVVSLFGE